MGTYVARGLFVLHFLPLPRKLTDDESFSQCSRYVKPDLWVLFSCTTVRVLLETLSWHIRIGVFMIVSQRSIWFHYVAYNSLFGHWKTNIF